MDTEIRLAPCKGSLTELIRNHGVNYYKASEYIANIKIANDYYQQKKEDVINFLHNNNINEEPDLSIIILWNTSYNYEELIKTKMLEKIKRDKEKDKEDEKYSITSLFNQHYNHDVNGNSESGNNYDSDYENYYYHDSDYYEEGEEPYVSEISENSDNDDIGDCTDNYFLTKAKKNIY
jgi:hypothetical protein